MIGILTDLGFLEYGQKFPPECERERLNRYYSNKELFEGEHAEVYKEQFKRIERVVSNFGEVVSYPVILNFQKLISLKTADLLFGEQPKISAGDEKSKEQKSVELILENSDLINTGYECAIDISRYGDGLLYIYDDNGVGKICVSNPCYWFPIVNPSNIKQVLYHVLAWTYEICKDDKEYKYLKCQIHSKGNYEEREYVIADDDTIGSLVSNQIYQTNLTDFAIIHVPNVITSDKTTGYDDYTDIDSIMSELMVRIGQIAKVLDKHSSPSVQGSASAIEKDPVSGEYKLKMGNFFPIEENEPKTEYIVWDANMDANFKHIEKLINFLAILSEMGVAIFAFSSDNIGKIPSGVALQKLFMSALAKVNRIKMRFSPALKKAIKLCSQLGGEGITNISTSPISITFQDGLPNDPEAEARILQIRTGSKPTMSVKRALQQYDGMTSQQAAEEIVLIMEEDMQSNPTNTTSFSGDNNPNIDVKLDEFGNPIDKQNGV